MVWEAKTNQEKVNFLTLGRNGDNRNFILFIISSGKIAFFLFKLYNPYNMIPRNSTPNDIFFRTYG